MKKNETIKTNVMIMHGAFGHPHENWFPWLKEEVNLLGKPCYVPCFPTPEGQHLDRWITLFNQFYRNHIHEKTILIGHSLGAVFLLRWLEKHEAYPAAVILVGTFLGNTGIEKFDLINKDFFDHPFLWEKIKCKTPTFICYHGDNDPYVKRPCFDYVSRQLNAKKIIISQGGHLNAAAGFFNFPQLRQQLKLILENDENKF
jgi:predicted alpha/beta hydrolase family esterase